MVPGKITPYRYGISAEKWSGEKHLLPTLKRKSSNIFFDFPYTEETILSKTVVKEQVVCSVDWELIRMRLQYYVCRWHYPQGGNL